MTYEIVKKRDENNPSTMSEIGEWHIIDTSTDKIIKRYLYKYWGVPSGLAGGLEGPISIQFVPDKNAIQIEELP